MNLHSRLNSIERKFRDLKTLQSDSVIIETGVLRIDENGVIDHSQARKIRVHKEQRQNFGVFLMPKQPSREEWIEKSAEYGRTKKATGVFGLDLKAQLTKQQNI
jgi:hypothetical protein